MELCFSCFTVKVLNDFRVITVARERGRLVLPKAAPAGRPTLLPNAAKEIPPMITVDVKKRHCAVRTTILNVLLSMSTFRNAFKIAQASVEKLKNFPLSCHQTFNTDRTLSIFHLHPGSKAPPTKDGLPPLFLESLVELMTPA